MHNDMNNLLKNLSPLIDESISEMPYGITKLWIKMLATWVHESFGVVKEVVSLLYL